MPRILLLLCFVATPGFAQTLTTHAERTGFEETGRYAETIALCDAFAEAYPEAVRCGDFGSTPEGRPMKMLVVSTSGALDAASARQRGLPVVLVQGGIHAGEVDGKDAGFLALRQLLDGEAAPGALDRLVMVFVPVFSVDGHERFGEWNRPNQRGPRAMGWRTTAQNYNLNRDYLKADSAEMQAMLALVQDWDPLLLVDLHATNGAQFEHDIAIQVEPLHGGDRGLREVGLALRDGVIADLAQAGSMPLPFYPSFVERDNPASGFVDDVSPPRFSTGYFMLRNRLAMLVETHSWKPYPQRVEATRNTVVSVLEHVAAHGREWQQVAREADRRATALGGTTVALAYEATEATRMIEFRGYAYTRDHSDISGAPVTVYDERTPQVWTIPLRDVLAPSEEVQAPGGGYLVPAAHAQWVAERLDRHGVRHRSLPDAEHSALQVEVFRATQARLTPGSTEGHQRLAVEGGWSGETMQVGPGALFVPIDQPLSQVAIAMLEPRAPDSLLAWGEFNNAFERKEYMEPYVAEAVARDMLQADPDLRARFEERLASDEDFAASPSARLEFFYRLHESWDERLNLYPVMRVDAATAETLVR